jgi:phage-related minor tail protein
MTERMTKILEQLTSIADRVESRIEKIEAEHGVDLTTATVALSEARELIGKATDDVVTLGELAKEALSSEDPESDLEEVRVAVGVAKESIRAVHQALRDAVVEIKAGTPEAEAEEGEEPEEETEE